MSLYFKAALSFVVISLLLGGCTHVTPYRSDVEKSVGKLPFFYRVEGALNEGYVDFISRHIDTEALKKRVLAQHGDDKTVVAESLSQASIAFVVAGIFEGVLQKEQQWRYLRTFSRGGSDRSVFLVTNNVTGDISYQSFIHRQQGEEVFIEEWTNYDTGVSLSEIVGVSGQVLLSVKQLSRNMKRGDLSVGLDYYSGLPEEIKKQKLVILLILLQENALNILFADYPELFHNLANEGTASLVLIAYYQSIGNEKKALALLTQLIAEIGPDSNLNSLKSDLLLASDNVDDALISLREAIYQNPNNINAHWQLLALFVSQQNYVAAVLAANVLTHKFNVKFADFQLVQLINDNAQYSDFFRSDEFTAWQAKT